MTLVLACWACSAALQPGLWPQERRQLVFTQVEGTPEHSGPRHALPPGGPSSATLWSGKSSVHAEKGTEAQRSLSHPGSCLPHPGSTQLTHPQPGLRGCLCRGN